MRATVVLIIEDPRNYFGWPKSILWFIISQLDCFLIRFKLLLVELYFVISLPRQLLKRSPCSGGFSLWP